MKFGIMSRAGDCKFDSLHKKTKTKNDAYQSNMASGTVLYEINERISRKIYNSHKKQNRRRKILKILLTFRSVAFIVCHGNRTKLVRGHGTKCGKIP